MDFSQWTQTWINVLTRPGEEAFQEERRRPYATLSTGLIWVVGAAIIAGILGWIQGMIFVATPGALDDMLGANVPPEFAQLMQGMLAGGAIGGAALFSIVLTPIFFLIGVGIVHLIARALGGVGLFSEYGFLAAAYSAPLTVISAIIGFIPFVGACLTPLISIYGVVLNIFAVKAAHNLTMGRAIAAVLLPLLILLIVFACIIIAAGAMIASLGV